MAVVDHVSALLANAEQSQEIVADGGGAPRTRSVPIPSAHVAVKARGLVRFFQALKPGARLLAKGFYLFPLFLIVKAGFCIADNDLGDYLSIFYVVFLLVFFSYLSILVVLYPFVGPPSKRSKGAALTLRLPEGRGAERALAHLGLDSIQEPPPPAENLVGAHGIRTTPIRVRGTLRGSAECQAGEIIARESWSQRAGVTGRLAVATSFAVVGDDREPLVVVEIDAAPWLIGDFSRDGQSPDLEPPLRENLDEWLQSHTGGALALDELGRGEACTVREGDRVEIFAFNWTVVPDRASVHVKGRPFVLSDYVAASAPYRRGHAEPAVLVSSAPERPVVIRKLA